jgi:hypothetical protein
MESMVPWNGKGEGKGRGRRPPRGTGSPPGSGSGLAAEPEGAVADWKKADVALRRIAKKRAALDAEELVWLLRARRARVHRHLGYGTFLEYMERVLGYTPKAASERLRVAGALEEMPEMTAALMESRLPFSAVRELTRVATPETEEEWIKAAQGRTLREIEPMVAGRRRGALPETPPDPALIQHKLFLEVSAETKALMREVFRLVRQEAGCHLTDDEVLAQIARAVLGGSDRKGRASYQIALTVCPRCDQAAMLGGGDAVDVDAAVLERARCDALSVGRVDGDEPQRSSQSIPPRTRRMVVLRDRGRCVVPGCRSARYLDVHHLYFRSEGGDHRPQNLALLCRAHHDRIHAGLLIAIGPAPDLAFFHADGRPYGDQPPWETPPEPSPEPPTMCAERHRPTWGPALSRAGGAPVARVTRASEARTPTRRRSARPTVCSGAPPPPSRRGGRYRPRSPGRE